MYSQKTLSSIISIIFLISFPNYSCEHIVFESNIDIDPIQVSDLPLQENKSKIQLNLVVNEENLEFHLNIELKNWVSENNGDGEFKKQHQFIKKLYIGLGTENLLGDPIDVIGINLEKDEALNENKLCAKNQSLCQIQDFSWCKDSKELKLDPRQHYLLKSLTSENNGNNVFVKFSRRWHTCDNKDLQPSIRPITLWWALKEVPISSELAMIESEIERQNGVIVVSTKSPVPTPSETATTRPGRIDLGHVRAEKHMKKLNGQFDALTNPRYEILNSLIEFGFNGPIKASLDKLFYEYAENLMILRCDMDREIMDIYVYRCNLQEYLSMRASNMKMKNDFYISALIHKGQPEDYVPNVKGTIIKECPLKQLQENYEKTRSSSTNQPNRVGVAENEYLDVDGRMEIKASENEVITGGDGQRQGREVGSGSNGVNHYSQFAVLKKLLVFLGTFMTMVVAYGLLGN